MSKGRKIDNGRYGKIFNLTKEYLIEKYVNQKISPYKIAQENDCSAGSVYDYLEYYGIPRNKLEKRIKENQSFNLLTTIKIVGKNHYGNIWLCRCSCGNEVEVLTVELKKGKQKSCGCLKSKNGLSHHNWKGYCGISGTFLTDIKIRAKKKNLDFDLDTKFLWELFQKQNGICALSGLEITLNKNASLDRIDSTKGYIRENVQFTHKDMNKMKLDFSMSDFIRNCELVYNYHKGGQTKNGSE